MTFSTDYLSYSDTNSFSKIVLDYIEQKETLKPFYSANPSSTAFKDALIQKAKEPTKRVALVEVLQDSYASIETGMDLVQENIDKLLLPNTFTICTAHQPNLFTGHLYFVYKIVHAIALAKELQNEYPDYHFVPVFYMGSEDADLEELGHVNINQRVLKWETAQTGAVGRMFVDDALLQLIDQLAGEFNTTEYGKVIIDALKNCYTSNQTIQQATLEFVHFLFGQYGLLVLIADDKRLKTQMQQVFKNEVLQETSHSIVEQTSAALQEHYKEQAHSRPINLFYLKEDIRARIEKKADGNFIVVDTNISFTQEALLNEIETHPERFSPNVILRGLYQETILPNIAFIGGGGEIAYWLQLKEIFNHYQVQFPILLLRNSFLLQTAKQKKEWEQLGFTLAQLFEPTIKLETLFVERHSDKTLTTTKQREMVEQLYTELSTNAASIDKSLVDHIMALRKKQLNKLLQLDKKLLKAEKRNFNDSIQKIKKIKNNSFPAATLQERYDNLIPYYAKWGDAFIDCIKKNSLTTEAKFAIITID